MKNKHFLLAFILLIAGEVMATPPIEEGKTIFKTRCAACHNINQVMTGPALAGVHERRSLDWIINFVHSSQTMVKSGDKDAVALFEKFNKVPMPDHPDLTSENIKNIVEYIKSESKTAATTAPFVKPLSLKPNYTPLSIQKDYMLFLGILASVAMLVVVLIMAVKVQAIRNERGLK